LTATRRALLVDDDATLLEMLSEQLELHAEFTTTTADTAARALELCAAVSAVVVVNSACNSSCSDNISSSVASSSTSSARLVAVNRVLRPIASGDLDNKNTDGAAIYNGMRSPSRVVAELSFASLP